jgi:two-component system, NtrC family, sensor histidine kinase HydH
MKHTHLPTAPINLRRRFALASCGAIGIIALGLGWLLANMLTERLLQREGEVTRDFVQNLLRTDDSAPFFTDSQNPEYQQRFFKSMLHIENMKEPVRVNAYRSDGTVLCCGQPTKLLWDGGFPLTKSLKKPCGETW